VGLTRKKRNVKTAKKINNIVLEKLSDYNNGFLKESQAAEPKINQDFSENEAYPKPFEMINKNEINKFLDKMTSKKYEGNFFDDTWDFYHPIEATEAEGVARHRSDFNISNPV
jgi:hypothetical protein